MPLYFCNENIEVKDQIFYCPIYMAGFLEKRTVPEDYIYTLDLRYFRIKRKPQGC